MVSGLGLDVSFVILDEQIKRKGQEETSREGMINFFVPESKQFCISHATIIVTDQKFSFGRTIWFSPNDRMASTIRIYKTEMKFRAVLGSWGCREKDFIFRFICTDF